MTNNRDKLKKTARDFNIDFPNNIKTEKLLKLIEEKQQELVDKNLEVNNEINLKEVSNDEIGDNVVIENIEVNNETKININNKYNDNELIIAVRKNDIDTIKRILKEDKKQAQFKNDQGLNAYEIAWKQECNYEILYLFKNNT